MRSHAKVVIVGGGAMGCGLAYHLAKEGDRGISVAMNEHQVRSMFKRLDDLERRDPITMQSLERFAAIKKEAIEHMARRRRNITGFSSTPVRRTRVWE